jgi:hypothetical protein
MAFRYAEKEAKRLFSAFKAQFPLTGLRYVSQNDWKQCIYNVKWEDASSSYRVEFDDENWDAPFFQRFTEIDFSFRLNPLKFGLEEEDLDDDKILYQLFVHTDVVLRSSPFYDDYMEYENKQFNDVRILNAQEMEKLTAAKVIQFEMQRITKEIQVPFTEKALRNSMTKVGIYIGCNVKDIHGSDNSLSNLSSLVALHEYRYRLVNGYYTYSQSSSNRLAFYRKFIRNRFQNGIWSRNKLTTEQLASYVKETLDAMKSNQLIMIRDYPSRYAEISDQIRTEIDTVSSYIVETHSILELPVVTKDVPVGTSALNVYKDCKEGGKCTIHLDMYTGYMKENK